MSKKYKRYSERYREITADLKNLLTTDKRRISGIKNGFTEVYGTSVPSQKQLLSGREVAHGITRKRAICTGLHVLDTREQLSLTNRRT